MEDPRRIHAQLIKTTTTNVNHRFHLNNLLNHYFKSNLISDAVNLFNQIPSPNVVSWTSLISGHSNSLPALTHFISMLRHPTFPNQRTLAIVLKTCASLSSLSFGLQLHSLSIKLSLSSQPFSASALIHFYSKLRFPNNARKVFDEMPDKDSVCFSSLIVGLSQNSKPVEALCCFAEMRGFGFVSSDYSVSAALRSCAELAALEQCRMVHAHSVVNGLDLNVIVGTALVDGYGKCGMVDEARLVFDELVSVMNLIGWNAMMSSYAQQGDKDSVLELFFMMESRGLVPDGYSILSVMTAFCNAGFAAETEEWFRKLELEYRLEPWIEHYTCLVGALGRAGRLEEANRIALTMPKYKPDAAMWRVLLSTSAHHGNVDMVKEMSQRLQELDPQDDSAYVIAANAFSGVGRLDKVQEVRKLMRDRKVKKEGGLSWIEVCGQVHVFLAGDRRHDKTEQIYTKLSELMAKIQQLGYVPIWDQMLHDVGNVEKIEALWYHSEKLALAFGLVADVAPRGKALRIVKNLRICRDCHEAFKYISHVVEREIIVRDVNRYHRFINGGCNCGDYW
uniref:putative pentatricopeptide repeat-containing protein At5g52630 n=1 Tax=Erigeron canadensis TaxID=72917 RepID=UPI001CB9B5C7|nr:putative pentatricopeptide repeat-containing protein At5g52630 [Erigeron canadensis]XP_043614362.1 putative pentatricopeptide repeat-containing protein At5g52630 [Erigeron canadensis]